MNDSKLRRDVRNFAVASLAGAVSFTLEAPIAFTVAARVTEAATGVVNLLPVPSPVKNVIAIALLDYTLYLWHVLTHRVPFLWRFHQVHHIDRDMDATTALRFHFGEIAISVPFRVLQVAVIGPTPMAVAVWQLFLFLSILFHHSNVRLPINGERRIARIVMTPRLHGIHHSIVGAEVNSNWSSGLTVWDWVHGTLRTEVPQQEIVIGVAGRRGDEDVQLVPILSLPFREEGRPPEMPQDRVREPLAELAD